MMIDLVEYALKAIRDERYATAEVLLRKALSEAREDEDIFKIAERHGFQDDFGRWNFMDENLLDFVHDLRQPPKAVLDSNYPDGDGYWSEK
jgi:hypothetical protein